SRKRGETVLGYLADRGVPRHLLDRVRVPVGLDLGHTSHREIAVSILGELVQLRAAGELGPVAPSEGAAGAVEVVSDALDPVCGMTVRSDSSSHPVTYAGTTYYFCSVGCRDAFEREPEAYISGPYAGKEA